MDPKVAGAISSHVNAKWDPSRVIVFVDAPAEGELDGLLLIGSSVPAPYTEALVTDRVEVPDGCGESGVLMEDVLFQTDAKLGRLSRSKLATLSTKSYLTREATVSRRELLTGVRRGFRKHSRLPFVFGDICEAGLGCSKCVDACPSKAIHLTGGSVAVSEVECTICGICAGVCPVSAIQMPEFSDEALFGLLDEIDDSTAVGKAHVLTCDGGAIERKPGMVVEEISSVGMVGPRQVAAAAASSLGVVAVVCPDGGCTGKDSARTAVGAVSGSIAAGPSAPSVVFIEGREGIERLPALCESTRSRPRRAPRTGDAWKDYIADLTSLLSGQSPTSGLGLSRLTIAESCTLCSACARNCPHGSLRIDERHLFFEASTCTGCGHCVNTCPERSMTLSSSLGAMSQILEPERIYQDELVTCAKCGTPIGSAKFVNKVAVLLGPDAKLQKYCPACKKQVIMGALFGGLNSG